jgi:hypothetical protein
VGESNTASPSGQVTRRVAQRAVAAMTRPEGMSRQTWAGVHAVLTAIARCYPRAYPSQLTLAARTGIPERSVRRYIHRAVEAGLLTVAPDQGAAPRRLMGSRTNRYEVKLASYHAANLAREPSSFSFGEVVGAHDQEPSALGRSVRPAAERTSNPPQPQGSTVVQMNDWRDRDDERQIGAPTAPALSRRSKRAPRPDPDKILIPIDSKKRARKRKPKPPPEWWRLVEYFVVVWQQMVLDHPQWKDVRPLESYGESEKELRAALGHAHSYIESHFANKTELEIRQMMNEFVIAVSKRDVTVKPGQSAWMCFTGAWGRQRRVITGDRYAAYRKGAGQ